MKSIFLRAFTYLIIIASGSLIVHSCISDDACKSNRVVGLKMNFLTTSKGKVHDTILKDLGLYGTYSAYLLDDSLEAAGLMIPLDPTADSISLVMYTPTGADTLELNYTHELYLLSVECGFITRYQLKSATIKGSSADSVVIINPTVDPDATENIEIYF